jgi:hypothetical protein
MMAAFDLAHDQAVLLAAFEEVAKTEGPAHGAAMLVPSPTSEQVKMVAADLERCTSYQAVARRVVYNANAGALVTADFLSELAFRQYAFTLMGPVARNGF